MSRISTRTRKTKNSDDYVSDGPIRKRRESRATATADAEVEEALRRAGEDETAAAPLLRSPTLSKSFTKSLKDSLTTQLASVPEDQRDDYLARVLQGISDFPINADTRQDEVSPEPLVNGTSVDSQALLDSLVNNFVDSSATQRGTTSQVRCLTLPPFHKRIFASFRNSGHSRDSRDQFSTPGHSRNLRDQFFLFTTDILGIFEPSLNRFGTRGFPSSLMLFARFIM